MESMTFRIPLGSKSTHYLGSTGDQIVQHDVLFGKDASA